MITNGYTYCFFHTDVSKYRVYEIYLIRKYLIEFNLSPMQQLEDKTIHIPKASEYFHRMNKVISPMPKTVIKKPVNITHL